ncbi:hypothetical protein J2Z23_004372 [Lederbergia galactosidilyticus]|uniref:WbqC family protein n=1 Tax=Lederbergia galactosidilytica TaxID=217031 RepID=UPI001AE6DC9E|nr:WbqC family protein [Lederbergia galactosidilytica]MBP1917370.1 hypothetical protein [Lederbergia galactosidilytica]
MKCAIMQPTYLPWAGYFSLLSSVDSFVFLDDVQFSRRSWQQRNRILFNNQEQYLTVPILKGGKDKQLISEVRIDNTKPWRRKHIQTLKQAYMKHPYGKEIVFLLEECINSDHKLLGDLNISIIRKIAKKLDLHPTFHLSSELPMKGRKSAYLINICHYLNMDTYISPLGSKVYIEEEGLFSESDIGLAYHQYHPKPYTQIGSSSFISHLSIVDMLANLGPEATKKALKEGSK